MLMANSVEGRFPFLDHRVIEFASAVPPRILMKGLNEKYLLKKAFGADLPPVITRRPKQPYRAPGTAAFFSATWEEETRELLSSPIIKRYGYFDAARVDRLADKIETAGGGRKKTHGVFARSCRHSCSFPAG